MYPGVGTFVLIRPAQTFCERININVNCICPQTTLTPQSVQHRSEEFFTAEAHRTPLDRLPSPEDHAAVALFLASSESDYLTGVVVPVDGERIAALRTHDD